MRSPTRILMALLGLAVAAPADAQVYVMPRRPGKSVVRYFDQDWKHADMLVGERIEGSPAGGIRLYFYEQERPAAERAAASIQDSYLYLADAFDFAPPERFPYILYSTYQEFLRTNLFPLSEGVLGVTSTKSLEVTLPFFGDLDRFEEVSTHELAHQFTIQKVRAAGEAAGSNRDPLGAFPLWFIEGMAEYYAQRGLDPETRMLLVDLVANPSLWSFHALPDFFDDYPGSVLWTYKVGQARIAFLEETYGEGTVQEVLARSPELVAGPLSGRAFGGMTFARLLESVTGDSKERIGRKFDRWAKQNVFPEWLEAEQDAPLVDALEEVRGHVSALDASPDGDLLFYRSIDTETGRSRLFLADPRASGSPKRVAAEGRPGFESLHPVEERTFDLGDDRLVYVAESRGYDVIYLQDYEHRSKERVGAPPGTAIDEPFAPDEKWWDVRINLGARDRIRLSKHGIIGAFAPTLAPDGERVAFIGLSQEGVKDIYVLDPRVGRHGELVRLTDDPYAERHLSWGPDGIVFNSSATEHGHLNLFRVDPDDPSQVERLTTEPRDHLSPAALPDGRLVFIAWDDQTANLQELVPEGVQQRSDVTTGLFEPAPGPDGGVWSRMQYEGARKPVRVPGTMLLDGPVSPQEPSAGPPAPIPTLSLSGAQDYQALAPRNWHLENALGFLGAGTFGVYGVVFASAADQLRNHGLVLNVALYGNATLMDGYLMYMNQAGRQTWGGGPFQSLRFRIEQDLGGEFLVQSGETFRGGLFSLRHPFDRFTYIQLDQGIGAAQYFLFAADAAFLDEVDEGAVEEWEADRQGARLQSETTVRLGLDTIRYHWATGPIAGNAALIEGTFGAQPLNGELYGSFRFDGEQYIRLPLVSGANLRFRAAAGTAIGGEFAQSFYLSSYDTLRGVPFGDPSFLLGRHFVFGNTELQVPLGPLLQSAFLSSIEGVVGLDAGGVADEYGNLWDKRVLDVAVGANLGIGPLVLRLHWARPIDVGAPLPETNAPWVPNISLGYQQL